jgi:signal transduction histidine kinase
MNERMNILLVDDQPAKLLVYEAALSELGENLIQAQSGIVAFEQLLANDIALVLMDVNMPGLDGFETAQMIRQHPRFQNTPIVFVSGIHVTDLDRLRGYQYGAVDYVPVPIIPELLRAKVRVFVELHRKTRQLETLNERMTQLQDEERRRIARELHDSVGQLLTAITLNNAVVESESNQLSSEAARRIAENSQIIAEVSKQVRTISYLLHPPLLDEAGLASALRVYVEGFSQRSRISTELEIPSDLGRLPAEIELSAFRLVQECLTNIHRHSGSVTATIRVTLEKACLRIGIEDAGRGFPPRLDYSLSKTQVGVGIQGMKERMRHLGGTLQIHSDACGTRVIAMLPIVHHDSLDEVQGRGSCAVSDTLDPRDKKVAN